MQINDILAQLKATEPQLFDKKGALVLEKFKAYLNDEKIPLSKESYTLNWLGKSYAKALVNDKNRTLLSPNVAHNTQKENAQSNNLLIQGDNLAVLKHLRKAYRNSIKMIYIDPPYNTGSDGFVYNDDRHYTAEQIAEITGENEEVAERIFDFINRNASSHSAWLTFMYPRLKVARELLKDDGVIFISIDDNEQAQLKMLCDEVFGEENFVTEFVWRKKAGGGNDSLDVAVEHEYIISYKKRNHGIYKLPLKKETIKDYKFEDDKKDTHGKYKIKDLNDKSLSDSPGLHFNITCPDGEILKGEEHQWKCNLETFKQRLIDNRIVFKKNKEGKQKVYYKIYLNEEKGKLKYNEEGDIVPRGRNPESILYSIGLNKIGNNEIKNLFKIKPFNYPKPTPLIKNFILMSMTSNDLILDFFAGSGTTAHAVMQLNAEDGGNRNYICVQLDEPTNKKTEAYKAGYTTIFEITRERIKRAAAKIKEENNSLFTQGKTMDLGFKEFKLEPYPQGYGIAPQTPQEGVEQGELFSKINLDSVELNTLLTTWTVNDGFPLTEQAQAIDLKGYTAYVADKRLYLLEEGFNNTHLADLLAKLDDMQNALNIEKIIAFGHHFDSKTQREIAEAVNQYKTRKGVQLYWETRYE